MGIGLGMKFVKYMPLATMGLSACVTTAYFVGHTFAINYHKRFWQVHRLGEPQSLDDETRRLAKEALAEAHIPKRFREPLLGFNVFEFLPFNTWDIKKIGGAQLSSGVVVGLPFNFAFKNLADVNTGQITLNTDFKNRNRVNWMSEEGQLLLSTLVISEEAKKFAILNAIYYGLEDLFVVKIALIPSCTLLGLTVGDFLAKALASSKWPVLSRSSFLFMGLIFGFLTWTLLMKFMQLYVETKSIKRAVQTDFDRYKPAAIEFYEKLITRAQVLRKMEPALYENYITPDGNSASFLALSVPLTEKLDRVKKMKKKKTKTEEADMTADAANADTDNEHAEVEKGQK